MEESNDSKKLKGEKPAVSTLTGKNLDTFNSNPTYYPRIGVATREDYAECRRIMRQASRNYTFASMFFPRRKLPHIEALYSLMRVGDDRVDVSFKGFQSPLEAIENWEETYWRAFETGDSPHPVMRAYLNTAYEFGIPAESMLAYFQAMKDDLSISRFPTFKDLLQYMEGSAIPVGRAMIYILGARPPKNIDDLIPGADQLSIAMQLSNFWRDIGRDWKIGRIYIPLEDMQRFHYTEQDLSLQKISPNFIDLMEFEFTRTEGYYYRSRESIHDLETGQFAIMIGLEIYQAILHNIRRNRYNVFKKYAKSGLNENIKIVLKAYLATRNHP